METLLQLPKVNTSEELKKLRLVFDKTELVICRPQGIGITHIITHTNRSSTHQYWPSAVMLALAGANCQCYEVVHCESKSSMEYYLG